jgi:hypothetical protein
MWIKKWWAKSRRDGRALFPDCIGNLGQRIGVVNDGLVIHGRLALQAVRPASRDLAAPGRQGRKSGDPLVEPPAFPHLWSFRSGLCLAAPQLLPRNLHAGPGNVVHRTIAADRSQLPLAEAGSRDRHILGFGVAGQTRDRCAGGDSDTELRPTFEFLWEKIWTDGMEVEKSLSKIERAVTLVML